MQEPDAVTAQLPRSPMADVEDRLGVQSIEEQLAERLQLVDAVADLRAIHGAFGTWDAARKSTLSALKMLLRAQYTRDKVKVSEARLDEEAHAHPDYVEAITIATRERAELIRLDAKIDGIDALIRRANGIVHFCSAEARL